MPPTAAAVAVETAAAAAALACSAAPAATCSAASVLGDCPELRQGQHLPAEWAERVRCCVRRRRAFLRSRASFTCSDKPFCTMSMLSSTTDFARSKTHRDLLACGTSPKTLLFLGRVPKRNCPYRIVLIMSSSGAHILLFFKCGSQLNTFQNSAFF